MNEEDIKIIKQTYKLHQDLHGKFKVQFDAVVKDVQRVRNISEADVHDVIKGII